MKMAEKIIRADSVNRVYFLDGIRIQVLNNISMEISEREFVVISGPSGAGKTTLLNILGGLDKPTSGEVFVLDRKLSELNEDELAAFRCANIGYVFQAYNLISTLTAKENIEFAMELAGFQGEKLTQKASDLLKLVGLAERGDHLPSQLSGGEQQRIAFARALANDPRIVLADEPTGNLDEKTGLEIVEVLKTLKESGKTVIVVTHYPGIFELADVRIRMMNVEIVETIGHSSISS